MRIAPTAFCQVSRRVRSVAAGAQRRRSGDGRPVSIALATGCERNRARLPARAIFGRGVWRCCEERWTWLEQGFGMRAVIIHLKAGSRLGYLLDLIHNWKH